jgi:HPt (histidine-containing phosphotransfer) domain-containing protein
MVKSAALKREETLLDEEKISYLIDLGKGKPDFMAQLFNAFTTCSLETLDEMENAKSDSKKISQLGHKLKGMAGNIGAVKLEAVAAEIEAAGIAARLTNISVLIREANNIFQATQESLARRLKN